MSVNTGSFFCAAFCHENRRLLDETGCREHEGEMVRERSLFKEPAACRYMRSTRPATGSMETSGTCRREPRRSSRRWCVCRRRLIARSVGASLDFFFFFLDFKRVSQIMFHGFFPCSRSAFRSCLTAANESGNSVADHWRTWVVHHKDSLQTSVD